MELSQAFSTQRDAVLTNSKLGPIQLYWNFGTNEQFEIINLVVNFQPMPTCARQVITTASETSVILPKTLIIKPSVLLGFDARNQINSIWGIEYIGDEDLRGIPTNKFKSCFYVADIRATVSATYYVSDVTKFQAYLPANESIILQIDVQIRNDAGRQDAYTYNVFRYSPNPRRREERQALETPTGVYCANRTSTLPIPTNIPDRVSSNSEALIPLANTSIFSTHALYDTEFQFSRFDVWFPDTSGGPRWYHYSEIHDFAVGLSYQFNHTTRQCNVRDITTGFGFSDGVPVDGQPNLLQMGSTQHLFLMDDVTYQYTGEKPCHDRVWCHVWIAEKYMANNTVQHREWYWSSTINGEPVTRSTPMKMILKGYMNSTLVYAFETNVFNFRRRPMTIFEIDFELAECYRALGPAQKFNLAVLSFKIGNEKKYPVLQNLNYLRLHIFEILTFTMFVRPIRISNLIVDKTDDDILVTFTLLDAPPRTGPVENPLKEEGLDTLIERLDSVINADGLVFRARYNTTQVTLRARSNSLNVQHKSKAKETIKTSGPKITGLWIGFVVAGLVVGAIGGFLLFGKLAK
ncbi:unnamed protein product [Rotaria sp. Silwood1]|nr:unnamed protein product [Rotaria sp. Silwood1]CAF0959417.1 unnamed protein product [Rotaria sp. Silwood1]CAF3370735.1 unnamed protein product [Rotaria sp. Silwood1]CAF3379922.1 unnamed protein product [Rotaria sp. Silwood1]CAF3417750.1 unnamed protein product [Rotaria sp. Silwood1]